MRKNEKLVKAMVMVPLATALVTTAAVPWQTGYTPGYSLGLTAYASEIPTERIRINLNDLKTDFDEDSGVTASMNEEYGYYFISLAAGHKYLIEGTNYINDSYVDIEITLVGDADVYFDHVYIRNDDGYVARTTSPSTGGISTLLSGYSTPLRIYGEEVTISGNLTLDTYHGDDGFSQSTWAIVGCRPILQNASIMTNGQCWLDDDEDTIWKEGSSILSAASDISYGNISILAPELKGKSIKGYRLYQGETVMKTVMADRAVKQVEDFMSLWLDSSEYYQYDVIEVLAEDGESQKYKRYDVEAEDGSLMYRIYCKEGDTSLLPTENDDHVSYTFLDDRIVYRGRQHTAGDWQLDADGKGVKTCLYCDKEMDSCDHDGLIETKDPVGNTCNTAGYTPEVCSNCGLMVGKADEGSAAKNHHVIHHDAVPASCQKAGTIEYWECTDCEKNYSDAECRNEIDNMEAPVTAHQYGLTYQAVDLEHHGVQCDNCGEVDKDHLSEHKFEARYGRMICACGMEMPELTAGQESIPYGTTTMLTVKNMAETGPENVKYQWYEKLTDEEFDRNDLQDPEKYRSYTVENDDSNQFALPEDLTIGEHTIICDMTCGESYSTVQKMVTVTKAEPSAALLDAKVNAGGAYTGQTYETLVKQKEGVTGLGEMTVKYILTDAAGATIESVDAPKEVGSWQVVVSIQEGVNYTAGELVLGTTTISKAAPVYTAPASQTISCAQSLSDIVLPAGYAFANIQQPLSIGEDNVVKVVYTPEDTAHYHTVQDIMMTIHVASHVYGAPEYVWSADGKQCKLVFTCGVCKAETKGHSYSVEGTVTSRVKLAATETAMGTTTYTVVYGQYSAAKDIVDIPMLEKESEKTTKDQKEISQPTPAKKGTILKDSKNKIVYTVTNAKAKDPKVSYTALKSKKKSSVKIPDTVKLNGMTYKVTSIAKNAFKGQKKLKTVTIGNNITVIKGYAFAGCSKLETVTIGKHVTTIGKCVFAGCDHLKKITILSTKLTKTTVAKDAFKGVPEDATIVVPKKKLKAYKKFFYQRGLSKKVELVGEE